MEKGVRVALSDVGPNRVEIYMSSIEALRPQRGIANGWPEALSQHRCNEASLILGLSFIYFWLMTERDRNAPGKGN